VLLGRQALTELQVLLGTQVPPDYQDLQAILDHQVLQVPLVQLDCQGPLEVPVLLVPLEQLVQVAVWETLAQRDLWEAQELLVQPVRREQRDQPVLLVLPVEQVRLAQQELPVVKASLGLLEQPEALEVPDSQDHRV